MKYLPGRKLLAFLAALMLLPVFLPCAPARAEYDAAHPEALTVKDLNCTACILVEAETGETVFEKNPDMTMYPASTTKILTTLTAITMGDLEATAVTSPTALFFTPSDSSKLGVLEGEQMKLKDLLYGTMLTSGNDGANVIAETVCGDIDSFVALMNRAAEAYGCTSTHFVNPHGYQDENHYTTARDMARIALTAMRNDTFREIADATTYTIPATNLSGKRRLTVANNWYRVSTEGHESCYYPYGTGIKTGSTSDAGYCYVGAAEKDGVELISVVFGCTSRAASFQDTIKLMEYGYSQYVVTSIAEIYAMNPKVIEISGFDTADSGVGRLTLNLKRLSSGVSDAVTTTKENLALWSATLNDRTVTEFTREFSAPVEAGEVMGTMSYYPISGGEPVVYQLIAARSIARRADLVPSLSQIKAEVENDPNPFPPLNAELVIVYLLLPAAIIFGAIYGLKRLKKKTVRRPKHSMIKPQDRYYV